jgi:hypothetical protein
MNKKTSKLSLNQETLRTLTKPVPTPNFATGTCIYSICLISPCGP